MPEFSEKCAYYASSPIVVVIGCGDMGMGCARSLGQRSPLLLVDINAEKLAQRVSTLRHEGYSVSGRQCDIANSRDVAALGEMLSSTPGVRVLAHVAAVGNVPGGWREVMNVDLIGAHLVSNAVAPHMVRGGVAVFISSTGSYRCPVDARIEALLDQPLRPGFLDEIVTAIGNEPHFLEAYFMAKQGVNRLAQRLAVEWGIREIRAVSVSPGLIDSTMGRTGGSSLPVYDGTDNNKRLGSRSEKASKEIPLARQGTLLEVVSVVEFLASDAASFVNGIDVPVDGGSTAMARQRGIIAR